MKYDTNTDSIHSIFRLNVHIFSSPLHLNTNTCLTTRSKMLIDIFSNNIEGRLIYGNITTVIADHYA